MRNTIKNKTDYRFVILGQPIALKRHRKGKWGMYDPQREEKESFSWSCIEQSEKDYDIIEGNMFMQLEFYCTMTKNWSKKKKYSMEGEYRNKRPDIDNYIKFVLDALQGYFFKDDAQLVELIAYKRYSKEPRTEITIMGIPDKE